MLHGHQHPNRKEPLTQEKSLLLFRVLCFPYLHIPTRFFPTISCLKVRLTVGALISGVEIEVNTSNDIMQLYHHPYSLDSQKVRLALEEKAIDYTSHHVNPVTGKNMDAFFFRMNPSAKLPVFQNGSHVIYDTIEIIKYIERIAAVSSGGENVALSSEDVVEWMHKIQEWDAKYFTLYHIPEKYREFASKFLRRVIIARMAEAPDMASAYHCKLREAYETEEKLRDPEVIRHSEEHLVRLLDEVEMQLGETSFLVGEELSLADIMLIPILGQLELLNLEVAYIDNRPNIAEYWRMVKKRASYKRVIGRYFAGWRRRRTLSKTWCLLNIRSILRKY